MEEIPDDALQCEHCGQRVVDAPGRARGGKLGWLLIVWFLILLAFTAVIWPWWWRSFPGR